MLQLLLLPLLLGAPPEAAPVVEGRDLPSVPGPQAPRYPDAAIGFDRGSLAAQIRAGARRHGTVPAVAIPVFPCVVRDEMNATAGWKAYRVSVPPGARVKARLRGDHEAWFQVKTVNKWGQMEQGMLQNRIPTGNPEASFLNTKSEVATVYFIVDTSELDVREAFQLHFTGP